MAVRGVASHMTSEVVWHYAKPKEPGMGDPRKTRNEQERDKAEKKQHQDELLDEALEESFPASDPPSQTQPTPKHKKENKDR